MAKTLAHLSALYGRLFPPPKKRDPINLGRAVMTLHFRGEGGREQYTRTVEGKYIGGHFEMFLPAEYRVEQILKNAPSGFIEDDSGRYVNVKYVEQITVTYEDVFYQPK